jgi:hypothetical protein
MKPSIRLKDRLTGLLLLGALLYGGTGYAAQVSLSDGTGQPGETVTVLLSVEDIPLDADGGFALDLDVYFDPSLIEITAIREGGLVSAADYMLGPVLKDLSLSLPLTAPLTTSPLEFSFGLIFLDSPGSGSLAEIDFLILPQTAVGQSLDLGLVLIDSNPNAEAPSLDDGSIAITTVVPLPAAFWFMLGGLGSLLGIVRRRR